MGQGQRGKWVSEGTQAQAGHKPREVGSITPNFTEEEIETH